LDEITVNANAPIKKDVVKILQLNAAAWDVYADPIVEFKR